MSAVRKPKAKLEPWMDAWLNSHRNPWLFATGVLGFLPAGADNPDAKPQLEAWQDQFLRDFFKGPDGKEVDNPRHSVRAGHGVGKGTLLAILALWFPLTHYDSKAVLTANSQNQLRDNNWPEIRKWAAYLPDALRSKIQIDEERLYITASPEMAFVVRRTASPSNPEALQGIHAKHVAFFIDEASGIANIVFEVAQGAMSTEGAISALFSNPTRTSGFFFDTHHKLRHRWKCWRVNCEDVPRARGHIQDVIDSYGKDSNKYRVRVLGEFPTADDDTVISLASVEAAQKREVTPRDVRPIWGVDVGRFGDDPSALAKRQGNVLLEPVKEWQGLNAMQVVGKIIAELNATDNDMRPSDICVDVIGIGAGVADRLAELASEYDFTVVAVNVAESASADDKYFRLRDELWFKAKAWFDAKDCHIPLDEKLVGELTAPTFDYHSNGRIVVESKKDMKKRGQPSPNKADAFNNTFAAVDRKRRPIRRDRYSESSGGSAWAA